MPSVLAARVRHSIHCNAEWRADWVCPVVRCSEAGRMVGRRNRSRSTRNRPVTGECITTGQAWEPSWFELWLSCCSMIPRSPRSKRTRRRATCERSGCYEKAGFERQGTVTTPRWSSRVHGSNTPGIRAEHAVLPNPSIEGDVQGLALLAPSCQTLNIMRKR